MRAQRQPFRARGGDNCTMPRGDTAALRFRRIRDDTSLMARLLRRQRRYEVHQPDGHRRVVTFVELDRLLNGRAYPADFWACIRAADGIFGEARKP
jgi:hypothetical protein